MTLCDFLLVPKLLLGNPESEALASQDRKLELPGLRSQAGAWEPANWRTWELADFNVESTKSMIVSKVNMIIV
jgi:hypothetical protein